MSAYRAIAKTLAGIAPLGSRLYRDQAPSDNVALPYVVLRLDERSSNHASYAATAAVTVWGRDWPEVDSLANHIRLQLHYRQLESAEPEITALRCWFTNRQPDYSADANRKATAMLFELRGMMLDVLPD